MRRIVVAAKPGAVAPVRIALLSGAYQEPEDFRQAGFATAVKERGLVIDLEFIAPDLGHLLDRSVLESQHDTVLLPAACAAGGRA